MSLQTSQNQLFATFQSRADLPPRQPNLSSVALFFPASFFSVLRLILCLLSAGAFRKQSLSLPLWENKEGAAIALSGALRAQRASLRESAAETQMRVIVPIAQGNKYIDD
jgi:hypothetical protein